MSLLASQLCSVERKRLLAKRAETPFPDPEWWCGEFLDMRDGKLEVFQAESIRALAEWHRVCLRSIRGAGKTTNAAILLLIFVWWCEHDGVDWKAVTTASDWRQVTHYFWPEVHKWARRVRKDRWDFNWKQRLSALTLKGDHGEAFGTVAGDPDTIEGAHASRVLFIYDEAKIIPDATWDSIEGAYSTGDAYAFAVSTPGAPAGRFYDIQSGKVGAGVWKVIRVTLEEAIKSGRVKQSWVDDCGKLWPKEGAKYRRDVLGEFAEDETDALLPLSWVEAAMERHTAKLDEIESLVRSGVPREKAEREVWGKTDCISVDVAYTGEDKTAFAYRHGWTVSRITTHQGYLTTQTAGKLAEKYRELERENPHIYAIVDGTGVGAGVVDQSRENGLEVVPFIAGARPPGVSNPDVEPEFQRRYANCRAAAWWRMRELLDPACDVKLCIPEDDELKGDLTTPSKGLTGSGAEVVEAKEKVRERLGRSTDKGDAVVMAYWRTDQFEGWEGYMDRLLSGKSGKAAS